MILSRQVEDRSVVIELHVVEIQVGHLASEYAGFRPPQCFQKYV